MSEESKNFIMYTDSNGAVKVQVLVQDETIWLTQKAISELFDVDRSVITKHLQNIFDEGELDKDSVSAKFAHTASDGKSYSTNFYNLDAIISVGYRVNSTKATQFRIWATQTLKEYIVKGFVMDDERLKQGKTAFGKDYFKELLERIRSIRASERHIYQQVTDLFSECSIDYDKDSEVTRKFFATIQNKFHYAITGKTSAEIIYSSADRNKKNMGLTTWKNAPEGRILKQDVTVGKNYLQEAEIKRLERTISSYFDYIEGLVERENIFTMVQLADSVNRFLNFNEFKVLEGAGTISKAVADKKAEEEYAEFNKTQKITSDFDKVIKKLKGKK